MESKIFSEKFVNEFVRFLPLNIDAVEILDTLETAGRLVSDDWEAGFLPITKREERMREALLKIWQKVTIGELDLDLPEGQEWEPIKDCMIEMPLTYFSEISSLAA